MLCRIYKANSDRRKQCTRQVSAMDKTTEKTANKAKTVEVKMDASGRVCIPKEIRKQLGLKPGVKITVEADVKGDTVILRPSRERPRLVNKDGVLIHRWDVFDDWLGEEFDDAKLMRDDDGEVKALRDDDDEVIDPYLDAVKWGREAYTVHVMGQMNWRMGF